MGRQLYTKEQSLDLSMSEDLGLESKVMPFSDDI